jgi:peptide-methionine (S)-S-oxide reductase
MRRLTSTLAAACAALLATAAAQAVPLPAPTVDASRAGANGTQTAVFAGGCFWGVEAVFRHVKGVRSAVSGYAGGKTKDPTYEMVTTGTTGHAESVQVVFDPAVVSYGELLRVLMAVAHDPTELNRQGPDIGTQYRSAIYTTSDAQMKAALASKEAYNKALNASRYGSITTEIKPAGEFYFAEDYHQQYLAKNPAGYCGLGGTGVSCPIGVGVRA